MTDTAPVTGPVDAPESVADSRPFGLTKGQLTGVLIIAGICGGVLIALWLTRPKGMHAPGAVVDFEGPEPQLCYCEASPEPHVHTEELAYVSDQYPPDEPQG